MNKEEIESLFLRFSGFGNDSTAFNVSAKVLEELCSLALDGWNYRMAISDICKEHMETAINHGGRKFVDKEAESIPLCPIDFENLGKGVSPKYPLPLELYDSIKSLTKCPVDSRDFQVKLIEVFEEFWANIFVKING